MMTSRERVRRMMAGELPDSFCISCGGMANDNMSVYAYRNLLKHLGMEDKPIYVYDLFQFIPQMDPEVIDRLGGDFVHAQRPRYRFNMDQKKWREGVLDDGTPCYYPMEYVPRIAADGKKYVDMVGLPGEPYAVMPKDGLYYDIIRHPLASAEEPEDLFPVHPAVLMSDEDVDFTAAQITALHDHTDKAVVLNFAGQLVEQAQRDFGFETFYINLVSEEELMHAYFRMITDIYMSNLKRILAKAGDKIDVIWFCDDMGTQQKLQFSIPTYREMLQPYRREMWYYIHENYPHIGILFHCCGAIFDLIPDLIEDGVNMLNVQISAAGMDPARLKNTYGRDVIFWGCGTDTQSLPMVRSLEEVKANARNLLEIFSRGGNYVFSQVHNFQADTSPERILAIFDTAKEIRAHREQGM